MLHKNLFVFKVLLDSHLNVMSHNICQPASGFSVSCWSRRSLTLVGFGPPPVSWLVGEILPPIKLFRPPSGLEPTSSFRPTSYWGDTLFFLPKLWSEDKLALEFYLQNRPLFLIDLAILGNPRQQQ